MVEPHAHVTQVVFRPRLLGLRSRRLLLHVGELLRKGGLSGREIDVERRNFLFDGPADDPKLREKWLAPEETRVLLAEARTALAAIEGPWTVEDVESALTGVVTSAPVRRNANRGVCSTASRQSKSL